MILSCYDLHDRDDSIIFIQNDEGSSYPFCMMRNRSLSLTYRDDRSHYLEIIDQTIQYIDGAAVHTVEFHRDAYNLMNFL